MSDCRNMVVVLGLEELLALCTGCKALQHAACAGGHACIVKQVVS